MMSPRLRVLGVVLLSVVLATGASIASASPIPWLIQSAPKPMLMKLRRICTSCPNYTITLAGDGTLTYTGGDFAVVQGTRELTLDQGAVTDLMLDFVQPDFLEMENIYPTPGTERMTLSLSIEMGGLSKAVLSEDGYGPALLLNLAHKIDDLPNMRAFSGWPH